MMETTRDTIRSTSAFVHNGETTYFDSGPYFVQQLLKESGTERKQPNLEVCVATRGVLGEIGAW